MMALHCYLKTERKKEKSIAIKGLFSFQKMAAKKIKKNSKENFKKEKNWFTFSPPLPLLSPPLLPIADPLPFLFYHHQNPNNQDNQNKNKSKNTTHLLKGDASGKGESGYGHRGLTGTPATVTETGPDTFRSSKILKRNKEKEKKEKGEKKKEERREKEKRRKKREGEERKKNTSGRHTVE
ncbi:hypothetical protein ES332_D07G276400v1 [Gossypium tomentosum]|uniref:Uncharacterized protein n=1 Tax=Gossypium tomentosum TaxID=34277 RepID=A0A5D2KBY5_GOSTO|nr:hypothetical protein ES332_D07G276400v1 [Gossypium tomentosum]